MGIFIVLLMLFLANAPCISQDTTGTVVILSDKVGPTIDLEERNFYKLFTGVEHFESAVLLEKPDGSYTFKITIKKEGEPSSTIPWITCTQEEIERIRHHIDPNYVIEEHTPQPADSVNKKSKMSCGCLVMVAIGVYILFFRIIQYHPGD